MSIVSVHREDDIQRIGAGIGPQHQETGQMEPSGLTSQGTATVSDGPTQQEHA